MHNETTIPDRKSNGTFERVIIHPDPILAAHRLSVTIGKRFWSKINKTDTCWLWTGTNDHRGGIMGRGGAGSGTIMARLVSWLLHFGDLPNGRIRNTCGNSLCVRPDHLTLSARCGQTMPVFNPNSERWKRLLEVDALPFDHAYATQDPTLPDGFSSTFKQRLMARVEIMPNGCWEWRGALSTDGYGYLGKGWNQKGNNIRVHIASWMIHRGPVPKGMCVLHNCPGGDRPNCCNPDHLWLGTPKDNVHDAVAKHRRKGEGHWNRRLNIEQVREMRRLHLSGTTIGQLSRTFEISRTQASKIVYGHAWQYAEAGYSPAPALDYSI